MFLILVSVLFYFQADSASGDHKDDVFPVCIPPVPMTKLTPATPVKSQPLTRVEHQAPGDTDTVDKSQAKSLEANTESSDKPKAKVFETGSASAEIGNKLQAKVFETGSASLEIANKLQAKSPEADQSANAETPADQKHGHSEMFEGKPASGILSQEGIQDLLSYEFLDLRERGPPKLSQTATPNNTPLGK